MIAFRPLLLSVFALAVPVCGHAAEITCPASIQETPRVATADERWTVAAPTGSRPLERVGIYLGPEAERGAQVPDTTRKTRAIETVTWHLTHSATDEFWIGCSYVGTTAKLFQKLDARTTECSASYDLLPSGTRLRVRAATCR